MTQLVVLAWVHDSQDVSLDCCHLRLDWGWRITYRMAH